MPTSSDVSAVLARVSAWFLVLVYAVLLAGSYLPLVLAHMGKVPAQQAARILDAPPYTHLISHWPGIIAVVAAVALALRYKWAVYATAMVLVVFIVLGTEKVLRLPPELLDFPLILVGHFLAAIVALLSTGVAMWLWKKRLLR